MNIKLGQKVKYRATIYRKSEYKQVSRENPHRKEFKYWQRIEHIGRGVIIGQRTLSNGYNDYDPECGNIYMPQQHFVAIMIATNLHHKPVFVKKEDILQQKTI